MKKVEDTTSTDVYHPSHGKWLQISKRWWWFEQNMKRPGTTMHKWKRKNQQRLAQQDCWNTCHI